jgi:hypothetical protein
MKKITILIILLALLCCLFPFLHMHYTIFYIFSVLIVMFIFIQSLSIPRIYKDILTVVMFIIYRNNIYICIDLISVFFKIFTKYPSNAREDNYIVTNLVTEIFNSNFRFKHNFENIPKHTTIFVANYISDRYENISCITLPIHVCPVMADLFVSKLKFDKILTHVITRKNSSKNNYEEIKNKMKTTLDKNISIFVYIEKESSAIGNPIGIIRSGMFSIAKELNISITPVCFDHIEYNKLGIIYKQNYRIHVGDTFYVTDIKKDIHKTRVFLRDKLTEFKKTKYDY